MQVDFYSGNCKFTKSEKKNSFIKKKDEKEGQNKKKIKKKETFSNLLKKNISFINSDSTIVSYTGWYTSPRNFF